MIVLSLTYHFFPYFYFNQGIAAGAFIGSFLNIVFGQPKYLRTIDANSQELKLQWSSAFLATKSAAYPFNEIKELGLSKNNFLQVGSHTLKVIGEFGDVKVVLFDKVTVEEVRSIIATHNASAMHS